MRRTRGEGMNLSQRVNPFGTFWGYVLSTLALAVGLGMGWYFHHSKSKGDLTGSEILRDTESIPSQAGQYRGIDSTWEWIQGTKKIADHRIPNAKVRYLADFLNRRAYDGAPPRIPHEITEAYDQPNCLACHAQGGYVAKFNAYAPMTPHPQFSQCRQCHVPSRTPQNFQPNDFQSVSMTRGHAAYKGAPPPIPHSIQMRENCSSCHVGPGAVKEIRTQHPERIGCLQCHVPVESQQLFEKPPAIPFDGVQP